MFHKFTPPMIVATGPLSHRMSANEAAAIHPWRMSANEAAAIGALRMSANEAAAIGAELKFPSANSSSRCMW